MSSKLKLSIINRKEFETDFRAAISQKTNEKINKWMYDFSVSPEIESDIVMWVVSAIRREQYTGLTYGKQQEQYTKSGSVRIIGRKKKMPKMKSGRSQEYRGETIKELADKLKINLLAMKTGDKEMSMNLDPDFSGAKKWLSHAIERPKFSTMTEEEQIRWIRIKKLKYTYADTDKRTKERATPEEIRFAILRGQRQGYDSGSVFRVTKDGGYYKDPKRRETLYTWALDYMESENFYNRLAIAIEGFLGRRIKGHRAKYKKGEQR